MHMCVSTVRKQRGPRGPAFTRENDDGISSNDNDKEAAINDMTISFIFLLGQRLFSLLPSVHGRMLFEQMEARLIYVISPQL